MYKFSHELDDEDRSTIEAIVAQATAWIIFDPKEYKLYVMLQVDYNIIVWIKLQIIHHIIYHENYIKSYITRLYMISRVIQHYIVDYELYDRVVLWVILQ